MIAAGSVLAPQRVHLSFSDQPFRMAMGLTTCDPGEMIELDERYLPEMAERRDLLDYLDARASV